MMNAEEKAEIDAMDYEAMLRIWRFAVPGTAMFQGKTGHYYAKVMRQKRDLVGAAEHTAASKRIGWGARLAGALTALDKSSRQLIHELIEGDYALKVLLAQIAVLTGVKFS